MATRMDELHSAWDNHVLRAGAATLADLSGDIESGSGSREFPERLFASLDVRAAEDAPGRRGRSPAHVDGNEDDPFLPIDVRVTRAQSRARAASRDPAAVAEEIQHHVRR